MAPTDRSTTCEDERLKGSVPSDDIDWIPSSADRGEMSAMNSLMEKKPNALLFQVERLDLVNFLTSHY